MTRKVNLSPDRLPSHTLQPKKCTNPSYDPPILLPASKDDISALARIEIASLSSNLLFRLYFPEPYLFYTHLVASLAKCFDSPDLNMWFVKALNVDGNIIGWGAWSVRPADLALRAAAAAASSSSASADSTVWPSWMLVDSERLSGGDQGMDEDGISGFGKAAGDLPRFVHDKARIVLDDWMLGRPHLLLNGLFTLPRYQKRGVGAAILEWGNARADAEGLPCFVQSTPGAYNLYKEAGWKDVGDLRLDLARWVPEGRNGLGWGEYRLRYLVRLAVDRREQERQRLVGKLRVAGVGQNPSDMICGVDYM